MVVNLSAQTGITTQIDVAKVITSAAGSALGIVALSVILLGAVAYGLFRNSGDRYKLVAFSLLIGGAGLLLTALLQQGRDQAQIIAQRDASPKQSGTQPGTVQSSAIATPNPTRTVGGMQAPQQDVSHVNPGKQASTVPSIATPNGASVDNTTPAHRRTSENSVDANHADGLPVPAIKKKTVTAWSRLVPLSQRDGWDAVIFTCNTPAHTLEKTKKLLNELNIDIIDETPANKRGFDSTMVMYMSSKAADGGQAFAAMLGSRLDSKINWAQATGNGADPDFLAKRLFIYLIEPGCKPSAPD